MQYLLTGDRFDANEAYRIGLLQRIVGNDVLRAEAVALAHRIANQSPLGVTATIRSARTALREGEKAAAAQLLPEIMRLAVTADAQEGIAAFFERRTPVFQGK